jgi:dipeptidase
MKRPVPHAFAALLVALLLGSRLDSARACTSFLVARGASIDGSTMVTYAADAHDFFGDLRVTPARRHAPGAMRDVYEWDTGTFLGRIREAPETLAVVGNMNSAQVVIAETTWGGREELEGPAGIVDYGSLIFIALERARTAREAVEVMGAIVAEYGYASTGETFSIADPYEVWIMDLIGKGKGEKGAVWVARRVPEGHVTAHANLPRIRQFPLKDPGCLYSKDVISFARSRGYFSGRDGDFSFADAYNVLTAKDLRTCDARVWRFFTRVAPSLRLPIDTVLGKDGAPRLPLWIKPDRKLGARDLMGLMRDHFEGTPLDLSKGVGAGPYALPYRWRPMTFEVDGVTYLHERATSTQQTGFSFVSQSRWWFPHPVGGLLWFGVDDTASTVYVPIYSGIEEAPLPFAAGRASFRQFDWSSAFWVFNFVANFAYGRYSDMIQDITKVQAELEGGFLARQPELELAAAALYKTSPPAAREMLTAYSARQAERTLARWRQLGEALLVKYVDGNVRDEHGKVAHPPYPEAWQRRIAADCGPLCRVPRLRGEPPPKPKGQPPSGGPAPGPSVPPPAPTSAAPGAPGAPNKPGPLPARR